jgi:hypothetical protein
MWRELLSMGRNPVDIAGRMLIFTWVGLSFGCLFYNLGPSFQDLQNKVNLLFVTVLALLLLPYVAISLFLADKQYFIADTNAGLLSPSAYYVAKLVVSTPLVLLNVAVLVLVLYGLVGLRLTVGVFFAYLAACALMYLISAQVRCNLGMLAQLVLQAVRCHADWDLIFRSAPLFDTGSSSETNKQGVVSFTGPLLHHHLHHELTAGSVSAAGVLVHAGGGCLHHPDPQPRPGLHAVCGLDHPQHNVCQHLCALHRHPLQVVGRPTLAGRLRLCV